MNPAPWSDTSASASLTRLISQSLWIRLSPAYRGNMTDETLGARSADDNAASKDPRDWVSGGEPATAAQLSYIDTLAREAGEEVSADLTKAQASEEIDRLQSVTGRGTGSQS